MKEWLEELERWGADVIFGRAKGFRAALMRFLMRALSGIFRLLVQARLWRYRSGWKPQHHLGTQVVAIGNITVGGTGKTPVVELLARSLRDRGRNVAILSRGYKSKKLDKPQMWRDPRRPPDPRRTHAQSRVHRQHPAARFQIRRRRTVHARPQPRPAWRSSWTKTASKAAVSPSNNWRRHLVVR